MKKSKVTMMIEDKPVVMTLEEYFKRLAEEMPVLQVQGKPCNHMRGLVSCVLQAKDPEHMAQLLQNYITGFYNFMVSVKSKRHKLDMKEALAVAAKEEEFIEEDSNSIQSEAEVEGG